MANVYTLDSVSHLKMLEWPKVESEDKLLWMGSKSSYFSVNMCYLMEHQDDFNLLLKIYRKGFGLLKS